MSDFDPLTNSILVFWLQTTVQSFIKFDPKLRPQKRWQAHRQTDASDLIIAMGQIKRISTRVSDAETISSFVHNSRLPPDVSVKPY